MRGAMRGAEEEAVGTAPAAADGGDGDGGDGEPGLLGELEEMIAGKKRREASEAQTRIDIDKEMDDVMDVGLHVNRPLAEALLGARPPTAPRVGELQCIRAA